MSSLAGCIPIWYSQYKLTSSDGVVAHQADSGSYGTINYKTQDGSDFEIMVDADRGSSGMLILFHAHVPADSDPHLAANELLLVDCPPEAPGTLKIESIKQNPPSKGTIFLAL